MESSLTLTLKRILLITLGTVLTLLNSAWADHLPPSEDERVLDVGYVEFPPYSHTNENGQADGIYIDITRRSLEHAGYIPRFHALPIARIYLYLQQGKIHLWPGLGDIPSLQGHVLESSVSPINTELNAWYLDKTPPIKNVDDMRGQRVILIAGYTYAGLLYDLREPDKNITIITTPTHSSALQMLELGRGDYLLDYLAPIQEELNQKPIANLKSTPLISQKGVFVVPKRIPHAEEILKNIEAAYHELGIAEELKSRYPSARHQPH